MPDACYYSLIERADNGRFVAWVPDLPEVTAAGPTEDDVLHQLSRSARQRLEEMAISGQPLPRARPVEELPSGIGQRPCRRLLLIIG